MSISDMKEFLTRYGISYADCVEKSDLVKRVQGVLQLRANNKATSRCSYMFIFAWGSHFPMQTGMSTCSTTTKKCLPS